MPNNSKSLWLVPYIYLFIGEIFLALSATALESTKWQFFPPRPSKMLDF
jgi:hypothetical protein